MLTHHWPNGGKPNRVVVIGANGFVGSTIMRQAISKDIPLFPITRDKVDLLGSDAATELSALLRPKDVVVAASAIAPVKTPDMLIDNITLSTAIADAIILQPVAHLINIGSDAIYADSPDPLTEDSCREPVSLHGVMHFARELLLNAATSEAVFTTIRPTLIYGHNDPHNGYGPNRFRRLAQKGEPIILFGEGEEQRDHIWVEDVADLVLRIIINRSEGVLNAATGTVISFREVANMIVELSEIPVSVITSPRIGPMPHNGYRPFDPIETYKSFPDFNYTMPNEGFSHAQLDHPGAK